MKRILITGSNGQLGKCIQAMISQSSTLFQEYNFIFKDKETLDLTNSEAVESFFFSNELDFCINCAAYTAVDLAEKEIEKAFLVNADAVANLAKRCKEQNTKFIHISTDYVFDGNSIIPYKENDEVNPQSVYGKSKLKGEKLAQKMHPQVLIIRTAWVYSHFGKNFVKTMKRLFQEKNKLNIVSDQIGSPTNAMDLADAILKIVLQDFTQSGIYHYSNSGKTSWYEFAQAIANFEKAQVKISPIKTSEYPTPAKRPKFSLLDTSKIQEDFQIQIPNWKESLKHHLSQGKNHSFK